jgi:hypothetical protein
MCDATQNPVESINAALGLDRLRSEFWNFFRSHGTNTFLFDHNWAALGGACCKLYQPSDWAGRLS